MELYGLKWGRKVGRALGKINAEQYCEILEDGMVESSKALEMEKGEQYFQQDNDPKHTSKQAKQWFEDNDIGVIS